MAGDSGTPLSKKLGIKPGARSAFHDPPPGYLAGLGISPLGTDPLTGGPFELIQAFFHEKIRLVSILPQLRDQLTPDGAVWLCWPKKASGVVTDLSDAVVRETGLAAGLVDVKVCSVNPIWSGLKFVTPLKDRPARRQAEGFA